MTLTKPTFPIWIEYYPKAWNHGHQVLIATSNEGTSGLLRDIAGDCEGYAEELAETVSSCREDKHQGHGEAHPEEDIERAFKAGAEQLLSRDFEMDWAEIQRKERMFKKWGGHMPEAVLMPDQSGDVKLILPDKHGDPWIHEVDPSVKGILPDPRELGAEKDEHGIGWRRKRRWPLQSKLRRRKRGR